MDDFLGSGLSLSGGGLGLKPPGSGFWGGDTLLTSGSSASSSLSIGQVGMGMQIFGAISGMIGSFYSAKNAQINLKLQSDLAAINARMAESQAQSILDQGQRQIGQITMRAGKIKSSQRAAMAANGIDLGVGSAAEVQATTDIMKETDALTINSNATRAAWAARTQSVNYQNQSLMAGVSADNISPVSAGLSSLLGSAGTVASSWYRDRSQARLAAALGM